MPLADMFRGDRYGIVQDPLEHLAEEAVACYTGIFADPASSASPATEQSDGKATAGRRTRP